MSISIGDRLRFDIDAIMVDRFRAETIFLQCQRDDNESESIPSIFQIWNLAQEISSQKQIIADRAKQIRSI
jgi:hypothetical protein